ncbi:MAG TPA: DNA polymerase III subunit delta' C-terminal domain-containing protein [Gammaproteobacteria bacterium]|nr:DNA polymerase III subunit delta' C-terminal domain-containing protein [Gammaproteobacteria bacterium]
MTSPIEPLTHRLLPWLAPALAQFDAARTRRQLGHAWLLSGAEDLGKINLALVLAHRLLGVEAMPATLDADTVLAVLAQRHTPSDRHPDLHWLYPEEDKDTISIEQVRAVIDAFALTAHRGVAKVAVIEPADALTIPAANALLKTLEEPTPDTYLLLVSHRPGRLPATIRSRCQHLKLESPLAPTLAAWLGVAPAAVGVAADSVGPAPLAIARAIRAGDYNVFNELQSALTQLCEDRLDPLAVAQSWAKDRTDVALAWLGRRLHAEIRLRLGDGSTEVTVPGSTALHNAWQGVPTRTLFDQHAKAEQLRNLLGSGLNVELALQALLNGFVGNRGRS